MHEDVRGNSWITILEFQLTTITIMILYQTFWFVVQFFLEIVTCFEIKQAHFTLRENVELSGLNVDGKIYNSSFFSCAASCVESTWCTGYILCDDYNVTTCNNVTCYLLTSNTQDGYPITELTINTQVSNENRVILCFSL